MQPLRIAITTGDVDGIGTEVVSKALNKLKPRRGVQFYLWRSPYCPKTHLKKIDRYFHRVTVRSWPEALKLSSSSSKDIIDINSAQSPPSWVEQSALACQQGYLDGMATAPLSKTLITKSGFKHIGHTEMLAHITGKKNLYMVFIGIQFNVLLVTGHAAHRTVASKLTPKLLEDALIAANDIKNILPAKKAKQPIALLGLNPHSGEGGLIGSEEEKVFNPVITKLRRKKWSINGPLVPDVAFLGNNLKCHSIFVCPYHDQGLIPFKMIHGRDSGVHITYGLPFVRTSVDHGTAKDIFGKNKANANSMIKALEWAIKLSHKKK